MSRRVFRTVGSLSVVWWLCAAELPAADELRRIVVETPPEPVTVDPGLATTPPEALARSDESDKSDEPAPSDPSDPAPEEPAEPPERTHP